MLTRKIVLVILSLFHALIGAGLAQTVGSGWNAATPIDPPAYDRANPPVPAPVQNAAAAFEASLEQADAVTPEIQALADGLSYDPLRIFDYVYNTIRYVHYFGTKKGAVLTWLERAGNDFDQCALLVALLRASGIPAEYQYGFQTIPLADPSTYDLENWFGGNLAGIGRYLASAGTAGVVTVNGDSVHFKRVWVKANIGGTDYVLDPAFKRTTDTGGIDLPAAMGYDRADLLSAAGGAPSANAIEGISYANLSGKLVEFSENLETAIETDHFDQEFAQVFGGRVIVPQATASVADLPLQPRYGNPFGIPPTEIQTWEQIPESFGMTFRFQIGDMDITICTADLQGKKLSLSFETTGNKNAQLWLDDELIAQETTSPGGTSATLNLEFDDPSEISGGAYLDRIASDSYHRDGTYALIYAFDANETLLVERQRRLDGLRAQGLSETSREIRTEKLHIVGLNWFYQTSLAAQHLSYLKRINLSRQHRFGRVGEEPSLNNPGLNSYYIDVAFQTNTNTSNTATLADEQVFFLLSSQFASAMEHGVFEQTRFYDTPSASTVNCIALGSDQGDRIFRANAANFGSVRTQLTGYATSTLDSIQNTLSANAGSEVLLPEDGLLQFGAWTGTGYALVTANQISMIIGGGFLGGFNSEQTAILVFGSDYINLPLLLGEGGAGFANFFTSDFFAQLIAGADPVTLANGSFAWDTLDLSAGAAEPQGWTFRRHYKSSTARLDRAHLGRGWDHNYNILIEEASDAGASFGRRDLFSAIPAAVAALAAADVYESGNLAQDWTVSMLCAKWAVDGIQANTLTLNLPPNSYTFRRKAGGSYRSPLGTQLSLSGSDGSYTVARPFGSTLTFNSENRVSTMTDEDGRQMTFLYRAEDELLESITDANGRVLTLNYTGDRLTGLSDDFARTVEFGQTGGLLTSYADTEGATHTYAYDAGGRLNLLSDALSRPVVHNTYDDAGRVIAQKTENDAAKMWRILYGDSQTIVEDPAGNRTVYLFDSQRRTVGLVDAAGRATRAAYNGLHLLTERQLPGGETHFLRYDALANLREIETPDGGITTFDYDGLNRLFRVTDAVGRVSELFFQSGNSTDRPDALRLFKDAGPPKETHFAYHPPASGAKRGALHQITTPLGRVVTFDYDGMGLLRSIESAGDQGGMLTKQYFFDARGDLDYVINARGIRTDYSLNGRRQIVQVIADHLGAEQAVSTIGYDANGLLERITDPSGVLTRFTYTATGKLHRIYTLNETLSEADDPFSENFYNNRDLLERTEDALNRAYQFTYFENNLLKTIQGPLSQDLSFTYDANNFLHTVSNGLGVTVKATLDLTSLEAQVTDAYLPLDPSDPASTPGGTQAITSLFNPLGRVDQIENRNGAAFEFHYDEEGRRSEFATPLNNLQQYIHDDDGALDQIVEPSGQIADFIYHPASGRLDRITDSIAAIDYSLDAGGNVETVTQGGATITRQYDNHDRVKRYQDAQGNVIQYAYYPNGQFQRITYPGTGKFVDYQYYRNGQLRRVTDWDGRQTLYEYYDDRRLKSITRPNQTTRTLGYNAAGDVETITESGPGGELIRQFVLHYDAAGQIEQRDVSPPLHAFNLPDWSSTVDADNRIASWNGEPVSYDPDGNMTFGPLASGALGSYTFNARNQLTANDGVSYVYDAEGNRIRVSGDGSTTDFVIDSNALFSRVLLRERDGEQIYSVYGLGLLYDVHESGDTVTYHYDQIGSTVALSNDAGAVTGRLEYDPFGLVVWTIGDIDTPFQYVGQWGVQTDANGLCFMRARYYNGQMRRFVNADPLGLLAGLNTHSYVHGDPVSYLDPNGEFGFIGAGIGALVGGVIGGVTAAVTGGDVVAGIAGGAVGGAFVGSGAGIVSAIALGATGGLAGDYTTQVVTNLNNGQSFGDAATNINGTQLATSTVLGGAFGGLGQYGANKLGAALTNGVSDTGDSFFRTMSQADYDALVRTGKIPATSETFISPTQAFSESYDGVLVRFNVNEGTMEVLKGIGVRDTSRLTAQQLGDLPTVSKGWTATNAFFKAEGNQINIGLGKGTALDAFNGNIINFIRKH